MVSLMVEAPLEEVNLVALISTWVSSVLGSSKVEILMLLSTFKGNK
ncbi:hypothetical protein X975_16585, partial [Stegodyphus mimosarum]